MSITLGWWLLPLVLTIVFFIIANRYENDSSIAWLELSARNGVAIIGSFMVWLIYVFAT